MLYSFKHISNRPSFNLAWEEYILKHIYDGNDVFLLWVNSPSIVVGRNQNIYEEVNMLYTHENNIPLFRRNSGGGSVYHDLGNINYTFITKSKGKVNNYKLLTKPIIDALNSLNIPVYFKEKSDIYLEDKKIGGNAQYLYKNTLLHHGTILFDANTDVLNHALKTKNHTASVSVKSRRAHVVNLKEYTLLNASELTDFLFNHIGKKITFKTLSDIDIIKIEELEHSKYLLDSWNYDESPKSLISIEKAPYSIKIDIEKGHIHHIKIHQHGNPLLFIEEKLLNMPFKIESFLFLKKDHNEIFELLFK